MKKRKLLVLFMAAACMAMPLSACEQPSAQDAALNALKENFVWTDGTKTYTNVKRIDGTVVDSDAEHNLIAVKTKETSTEIEFEVIDVTTGKAVNKQRFSYSSSSPDSFDVEIDYPLVKYTKQSGIDSQPQYEYYLAKARNNSENDINTPISNSGYSFNEYASVREFDGLYEVTVEKNVYWIDEELNVLRELSTIVTGGYTLNDYTFKAANNGFLYTWSGSALGRRLQVFNHEGVCSMQYNFPSDVVGVGSYNTVLGGSGDGTEMAVDVHVLNNGNVLVQEWANVTDGAYNFQNVLSGQKFKITTKVIDFETGAATEVKNFNYFVTDLARANEDDHDFPFDLAEGKQNQAYLQPFTLMGVSEDMKYVVMDNNGKVGYSFNNARWQDSGFNPDRVQVLGDKYYSVKASNVEIGGYDYEYGYSYYVYDVSGKQVLQLPLNVLSDGNGPMITSSLYVTEDGIYNYSKECVYSFATSEFNSSRYEIDVEVISDGVYLWVEDEIEDKGICYRFDETTKTMVQFMLEGEDNDITLTDSYMVIKDVQNGTYTLYNKKGVALLKTQGHSDVQQSGEMNVVELDGYLYIQAEINKNPVIYLVD